ncbi:hypothetical protein BpHYR1_046370 [Brachionus plicatilis]|uniref:Uncharacterized protein n=1 Tax=Brachionus plicatilis TaxID=10195 RepID=A0A3M7P9N7_BRAPC|nr:hypothetical protein BpHYR1_046370 [Brachionus plicatilis]
MTKLNFSAISIFNFFEIFTASVFSTSILTNCLKNLSFFGKLIPSMIKTIDIDFRKFFQGYSHKAARSYQPSWFQYEKFIIKYFFYFALLRLTSDFFSISMSFQSTQPFLILKNIQEEENIEIFFTILSAFDFETI